MARAVGLDVPADPELVIEGTLHPDRPVQVEWASALLVRSPQGSVDREFAESDGSKTWQKGRVAVREVPRPSRHTGWVPQVADHSRLTAKIADRKVCVLVPNGRLATECISKPDSGCADRGELAATVLQDDPDLQDGTGCFAWSPSAGCLQMRHCLQFGRGMAQL